MTCISIDRAERASGQTGGQLFQLNYFADDVAAFMPAIGVERAHIRWPVARRGHGLWPGAKYPRRVHSLSLHSGWTKTDPFLKAVVEGWQTIAKGLGDVTEMVIQGIFPCSRPSYTPPSRNTLTSLQRLCAVGEAAARRFLRQSNAVIAHDALAQLTRINAPTQITFGRHDLVTSTRFADALKNGIKRSELMVFESCSHAPIYESVSEFNQKTLSFLSRHAG